MYPVELPELVNKAITVGGVVHGSPYERSLRRSSIASMVLSSVRMKPQGRALATTGLYDRAETTEKTGISFRLGMAFAAVIAGRILGVPQMMHVSSRAGGKGRRADLMGSDRSRGWHVLEAKSRTYDIGVKAMRDLLSDAKAQSSVTANDLSGNRSVATFCVSLAQLWRSPIRVILKDPPPDDDRWDLVFSDEAFFTEYYSPVVDLLDVRDAEPSGVSSVDDDAVGAWLPGGGVWLGISAPLLAIARRQGWVEAAELAGSADFPRTEDGRVHGSPDGHTVVVSADLLTERTSERARQGRRRRPGAA